MPTQRTDFRIQVTDLVNRPGTSRPVDVVLPVPEDFTLPLFDLLGGPHLVGVVESVVDGLLVRGNVSAQVGVACARCLVPLTREVSVAVTELFCDPADIPADAADVEPGYEIRDGHLDLDALLRDALAPTAPRKPLCREECAGLCPQCGVDLNAATCDCTDDEVDSRWAVLENLRLGSDTHSPPRG